MTNSYLSFNRNVLDCVKNSVIRYIFRSNVILLGVSIYNRNSYENINRSYIKKDFL